MTIMRQTINKTLYGVNMYIQCFVLHIVLNNSKSQQDGEHCSFQSMNTEKGVAINQISSLSYISHPVILLQGIIAFGAVLTSNLNESIPDCTKDSFSTCIETNFLWFAIIF